MISTDGRFLQSPFKCCLPFSKLFLCAVYHKDTADQSRALWKCSVWCVRVRTDGEEKESLVLQSEVSHGVRLCKPSTLDWKQGGRFFTDAHILLPLLLAEPSAPPPTRPVARCPRRPRLLCPFSRPRPVTGLSGAGGCVCVEGAWGWWAAAALLAAADPLCHLYHRLLHRGLLNRGANCGSCGSL